MNGDRTHLLIPIHIDALVVGALDRDSASSPLKNGVVSAAPNYSLLKQIYKIGADLRQLMDEKDLAPGIHLHFRLPAAAAHADLTRQQAFPRIPNRWLVQRYFKHQGALRTKAWLVYSDKEAKDPTDIASAVVLLVGSAPGEFSCRPTGMARVIWDGDSAAGAYDYGADNAAAEVELTAVTGSDPGFSAHYPACRSILGFYDAATDIPADPTVKLSYLVSGWYSAEGDDPWSTLACGLTGQTWAQLGDTSKSKINEWMADRGCITDFGSKALPGGILCHGTVQDVARQADGSALTTKPDPFVDFESLRHYWVDLGNTSAEAFAARVATVRMSGAKSANPVDIGLLEDLVTALQIGLFSQGSSAAELDAELHRQAFAATAGGKTWAILQAAAAVPERLQASALAALPPLPADLQLQLDELNKLERKCDRHERLLRDFQWELYALWHRWTDAVKRNAQSRSNLKLNLDALKQFVSVYETEVRNARQKRDDAKRDLGLELARRSNAAGAPVQYSLSEQPAAPFYVPKDPVLLLTGPAAQAAGTRSRLDTVTVRVTGDELQSFSYDRDQQLDLAFEATDAWLQALGISPEYLNAIPPWCARLLREVLLLDEMETTDPPGELRFTPPRRNFSTQYPMARAKAGVLPDPFTRFNWEHNPWIPLYVHWKGFWQPDETSGEIKQHWTLKHAETNAPAYRRNTELAPLDKPLPKGKKAEYKGLSFIGRPLFTLQYARGGGEREAVSEGASGLLKLMKQINDGLGSRPGAMISQALTGLHDALIMRQAGDQLPPLDYGRWKSTKEHRLHLDPLADVLGKDFHPDSSPFTPNGGPPADTPPFHPLRNGIFELGNLWIIDAFGQRVRVEPAKLTSAPGEPPGMCLSGRLSPEEAPAVRLHPRFCRPMRLEFASIPAEAPAAGEGPVCGWVVLNRFDQNLVLYAANGRPVGILQKRFATEGDTLYYWLSVPGARGAEAKADGIRNAHLRGFANFVLSLGFAAGRSFAALINDAVEATRQRVPEDNPLVSILMGRPLALVRAELRLEMDGLPALDQKLSWIESGQPGEPSLDEILNTSLRTGTRPPPNRFMKTGEVEKVRWPVRLGDRRSGNDGLVGFFRGEAGSRPFYAFWGYDSGNIRHPGLEQVQDLELDCDNPLQVTLLMDPQARVHATTGMLPKVYLELPAAQLKGARQVREVFFQTAPVLGTPAKPHVPKPSDDYGQWSWAYRPNVTGWAEDPNLVSAADLATPELAWPALTEGWLKLKIEPVLIRSLWMKAPATKPRKGTNVTLAWSLHGADTVEVFRLRADGTEEPTPENQWGGLPLGIEWTSFVDANTTFRIKASNKAGYEDHKDLEIEIEE